MHTEVNSVVSLDASRDGGSLCMAYIDSKSTEHSLVFRIDHANSASGHTESCYKSPLIESRIKAGWLNPITCLPANRNVVRKTPITWQEAAKLIEAAKSLVNQMPDKNSQVLACIEQAIRRNLSSV